MGTDDWTLTGETISIATDLGIYIGEVLRKGAAVPL